MKSTNEMVRTTPPRYKATLIVFVLFIFTSYLLVIAKTIFDYFGLKVKNHFYNYPANFTQLSIDNDLQAKKSPAPVKRQNFGGGW